MRKFTLLLLIAATTSHLAIAGQSGVLVFGIGAQTCGEYQGNRQKYDNEAFSGSYAQALVNYTVGYMGGRNEMARPAVYSKGPDNATVVAYVDKYCKDHPLAAVHGGVRCLMDEVNGLALANYCKQAK